MNRKLQTHTQGARAIISFTSVASNVSCITGAAVVNDNNNIYMYICKYNIYKYIHITETVRQIWSQLKTFLEIFLSFPFTHSFLPLSFSILTLFWCFVHLFVCLCVCVCVYLCMYNSIFFYPYFISVFQCQ